MKLGYELPYVIDSTMIVAYRRCPRYMFYTYVNHLRSEGLALPLLAGGAFATGVETYREARLLQNLSHEEAQLKVVEALILSWGDYPTDPKPSDPRNFHRVLQAVFEYFENYPVETDPIQPHQLATTKGFSFEFSFAVELRQERGFPLHPSGVPFLYAGRADALGKAHGLPVFQDDKSTTRLGDTWVSQWGNRNQFTGYTWCLRELGLPHRHVIVRGICFYAAQPTFFIETPPINYPDYKLDIFEEDLKVTLREMVADAERGEACGKNIPPSNIFPRRVGDACRSFNRACSHTDLCFSRPENIDSWLANKTVSPWDPLRRH